MGRKLTIGWTAVLVAALALIATAFASSNAFAGGTSIKIGQVTALSNADAQVRLEADAVGAPGLGAWEIDIDYNSSVITPNLCTPGPSGICNPNFGPSTVRIVGADAHGLNGNVVLGTLRFHCNAEGASALAITAVEFADSTDGAPQPIDVTVHHGSINCLSPVPQSNVRGDANCDGVVNSIDALIVLQYVAALRSTVPCPDLADYNHDGRITAVDAALILQDDAGLI